MLPSQNVRINPPAGAKLSRSNVTAVPTTETRVMIFAVSGQNTYPLTGSLALMNTLTLSPGWGFGGEKMKAILVV